MAMSSGDRDRRGQVPGARRPALSNDLRRNAFTLIELVVVIVIMSLLATLAVISFGGTIDRYQLGRAMETIEMFDARARRDARTLRQPVQTTIDRNDKRLVIHSREESSRYRLPRTVEIRDIRIPRRAVVGGDFEIEFNREGRSVTYAIELGRGDMTRWMLVLGASGQVLTITDEREVDEILSH